MKTTWHSSKITANGIQIHYSRSGGQKPALVLSHGATDDGACWLPLAELLAEEYDVILPDARGHGKSEIANCDYGVVSRADDLLSLIDVLKLDQPIIMGHSMGAQTSLFAAAMEPDKFRAVLLEDPVLILKGESIFGKETGDAVGKSMQESARRSKKMPQLALRAYAKNTFGWSDAEVGPWADSKKLLSDDFIKSLTTFKDEPDAFTALSKITCPVLLITGNREKGAIVSEAAAQKAKNILPNLDVVNFDAGHNIRREVFEGYFKAVKDFLQGLCA